MSDRAADLIPGLKYHSLLAATAHGLRVYVDHRSGQMVTYGTDVAHPDHLRFLVDLLERKSPKIEDYAGPIMEASDLRTLLDFDTETLFQIEQGSI